jgi:hypothetical protein
LRMVLHCRPSWRVCCDYALQRVYRGKRQACSALSDCTACSHLKCSSQGWSQMLSPLMKLK